jgi:3'-phosphoadenosine 5'-phosphosulfate sulfotransferase (PAPS reductase)/FAD synthetase
MFTKEEALFYSIHYKRMQQKIKNSLNDIERALSQDKKLYISVSWGKDSQVVLALVSQFTKDVDVIWIDRGEGGDIESVYQLSQEYERQGYKIHCVKTEQSIFDLYSRYSLSEIKKNKLITKELKTTLSAVNEGYDGFFWGLRAEECYGRRKYAQVHGDEYQRKSGKIVLSPVLWWSAKDIWAYICVNNIKYNPIYDILSQKSFDRENIRYSNWAGLVYLENGRFCEIQREFPELFNKLAAICPEVRRYI